MDLDRIFLRNFLIFHGLDHQIVDRLLQRVFPIDPYEELAEFSTLYEFDLGFGDPSPVWL